MKKLKNIFVYFRDISSRPKDLPEGKRDCLNIVVGYWRREEKWPAKTYVSLKDKHELGRGEIMATIGDVRFSRVHTRDSTRTGSTVTQSEYTTAEELLILSHRLFACEWLIYIPASLCEIEGMRKFKSDSHVALTPACAHDYAKYNGPIT